MNAPRIVRLAQVPGCIDALARAHVEACGALQPGWSVEQAAAELASHGNDGIPATWVMLDDNDPRAGAGQAMAWLGSVSLLHDDHPSIGGYSPWLASLYVRPRARGRGAGEALAAHCVAAARQSGIARLFLYCESSLVAYYARLGWSVETRVELPHLPAVAVMAIDTAAGA
ncbi:GNAT family N-acetyltransferase [[Pseudomonas] boreopolis]|uniref:GNAT family N-acetyltransferase n=1 Tax=Xanthomonas boreopolis TaxID=86183 RepID=UPI003D9B26A0